MNAPIFTYSKYLVLSHRTNADVAVISHNPNRLIPHSISCNIKGGPKWVEGRNEIILKIKNDTKILNIDIRSNFYDFGNETDTPMNRGKAIYKFAMSSGADIIKLKNVPLVGTEYCILNTACIKL